MGPDLLALEAAEVLVGAFLLLAGVNIRVICVDVTADGPVEEAERPRVNVQLLPLPPSDLDEPPAGHTPMRFGEASAEAERIWAHIVTWARAEEAREEAKR